MDHKILMAQRKLKIIKQFKNVNMYVDKKRD
jgi:hypothetical protein